MDIEKELAQAKESRAKLINQINEIAANEQQLAARKNALGQEALRLDGEVRALQRLSENGDKPQDK